MRQSRSPCGGGPCDDGVRAVAATVLSHETLTTTVLFDREIVRILNKHCVMCHVENGPSFPLATYETTGCEDEDSGGGDRPPHAAVGGGARLRPVRQREQPDAARNTVPGVVGRRSRTAKRGDGVPQRAGSGLPRPKIVRADANFGQWQLGSPSLTRELPANTIAAQRTDFVTRTVVDLGLTSERRVRALEYMPGDRRVVRAAFFTLQETGSGSEAGRPGTAS